jgi:hypothetical protein
MARFNLARVTPIAIADSFDALLARYHKATSAYEDAAEEARTAYMAADEALKRAGFLEAERPSYLFRNPEFLVDGPRAFGASTPRELFQLTRPTLQKLCERFGALSTPPSQFRKFYKSAAKRLQAKVREYDAIREQHRVRDLNLRAEELCRAMFEAEKQITDAAGESLTAAYAKLLVLFNLAVRMGLHREAESESFVYDDELAEMHSDDLRTMASALNIIAKLIGRPTVTMPPVKE